MRQELVEARAPTDMRLYEKSRTKNTDVKVRVGVRMTVPVDTIGTL